jgi:DNA polymerase-3 subunit alpha
MFIHLHSHSDGSLQDGAQSVSSIAKRAAQLGMTSVALTDHGRMGNILQFYKACKKENVKPILGCELYVAPTSRLEKEKIVTESKTSYHLTVLAKNDEGLQNLFRLTSIGWLEGYYYKPRVDMEMLTKHHEGLVVLSGCGSGRLSVYLSEERYKEASQHALEMQGLFGDDFYLEVQNHGISWQQLLKKLLFTLSDKLSIPIVATQDSHYTNHEDSELHNHICKLAAGDLSFDSDQSWFKSEDEMKQMFEESEWHAIERTEEVAGKCTCEWDFGKTIWPVYDLPEGRTPEDELRDLAWTGFEKIFGEGTEEYRDRLEYELDVIKTMGFSTYFLVVQDFTNWARRNNIPVGPGRGSGAGSLVCYCTGITEVDPIKYGLYFERFLNPARVSLPDIDMDFCKTRRSEVLAYVAQKYGSDRIAQIGTYAQFKPRGSLRAFARVCGYETIVGHTLASMVPPDVAGRSLTFDEVIKAEPKILKTEYPKVVELARKAEGLRNQAGVHAAGVVIANDSISSIVPLFRGKHDEVTTQLDMHDVEEIGLVKYDFLGLKTLTVIKEAEDLIARSGFKVDWKEIQDGDAKTYDEVFKRGDLDGVFQFETSGGFKDLCMRVKPECIDDLSCITALFRPGPLGTGLTSQYVAGRGGKPVEYLTPELKPILKETYGVMCYQEQIMRICTDVAGYTLPEADNMRKIIGKKLPEKMKLEREKFVSGCVKSGVDDDIANKLFDDIEGFAKYSFNKAHSVAYSIISYRTAWLKAHYPKQFYAALMNNSLDRPDKIVKYIHSAKEKEISIQPPDVNRSSASFTLDGGTILFGLSGISGMGDKACEELVATRPQEGFRSIEDLILAGVNKKTIVALAECGGLEEITELGRHQVVDLLESLIKYYDKKEKFEERKLRFEERNREIQDAITAAQKPPRKLPKLPDPPEKPEVQAVSTLSRGERLKLERKTLGFYLTGHPLDDYPGVSRLAQYTIDDILEGNVGNNETISIPVVISEIKKKRTRKQKNMAVMIIEDRTGRIEATVFPRDWDKLESSFEENMIAVVRGRVHKTESDDEDSPSIVSISINGVEPITEDMAIRLNEIVLPLQDGSKVTFLPNEYTNISLWQQAMGYVQNVIRMGYK